PPGIHLLNREKSSVINANQATIFELRVPSSRWRDLCPDRPKVLERMRQRVRQLDNRHPPSGHMAAQRCRPQRGTAPSTSARPAPEWVIGRSCLATNIGPAWATCG